MKICLFSGSIKAYMIDINIGGLNTRSSTANDLDLDS